MIKIVKVCYILDEEDKKFIQKQMFDQNLNYRKLADKLGISLGYLGDILNGDRNLSTDLKEKFESQGIVFKGE